MREAGRFRRWLNEERTVAQRLLVLAGCSGLGVTQPILDQLGSKPVLFTFNHINGAHIVWIAILFASVPFAVVAIFEFLITRLHATAGKIFHLASVAVLLTFFVGPPLKFALNLPPIGVALMSALVAAVVGWLYVSFSHFASALRVVAVLPIISLVSFLFFSQSGQLIGGQGTVETLAVAPGEKAAPPVVFLVLDELPTKSLLDASLDIDAVRFPNLAAFAEEATWYRHATTNSTMTLRAAPAIVSGRDGDEAGPYWIDYPATLFTALAPTHDLNVIESFTQLCGLDQCLAAGETPSDIGQFADQVKELYVDRVSPRTPLFNFSEFEELTENQVPGFGSETADADQRSLRLPIRFERFMSGLVPTDRPGFHYLHLLLPHQPWRHFADGQYYNTDESTTTTEANSRHGNGDGPWLAALREQRHLEQSAYSDRLVGVMIERLRDIGLYDDALVVVVADHGISFEANTHFRLVHPETIDSIGYVPLLIKYPGQVEGVIDDSNVTTLDIAPTVAAVLGIEAPEGATGLPIGSEEQLRRGSMKQILDVSVVGPFSVQGVVDFDDADHFPDPNDRWIRPGAYDALSEIAGVSELIGSPLASLDPQPSDGTISIDNLGRHEEPPAVPEAVVVGRTSAATEGVVLIAVDGVIVAASPLYDLHGTAGSFSALLPRDAVTQVKTLEVALLQGDIITSLIVSR